MNPGNNGNLAGRGSICRRFWPSENAEISGRKFPCKPFADKRGFSRGFLAWRLCPDDTCPNSYIAGSNGICQVRSRFVTEFGHPKLPKFLAGIFLVDPLLSVGFFLEIFDLETMSR